MMAVVAIAGSNNDDVIRLWRLGDNLYHSIQNSSGSTTNDGPISAVTQVTVSGLGGNDRLTLDLNTGDLAIIGTAGQPNGIQFDGGAGANIFEVIGGTLPAPTATSGVDLVEASGSMVVNQSLSIRGVSLDAGGAISLPNAGTRLDAQNLNIVGATGTNRTLTVGADALIQVGGAMGIAANTTLVKDGAGTLTIAGAQTHGAGAKLLASVGTVNFDTDAGSAQLNGGPAGVRNLTVEVNANALARFRSSMHLATLNVHANATAQVTSGTGKILVTDNLLIDYHNAPYPSTDKIFDGTVDVTNNNLAVFGSTTTEASQDAANVIAAIKSGYASGAWTGKGVLSSTAYWEGKTLSYATNKTVPNIYESVGTADTDTVFWTRFNNGSFATGSGAGEVIPTHTVLIKYTERGDTNLDGDVDSSDLSTIYTSSQNPYYQYPGNTYAKWEVGDINYDGLVNNTDYTLAQQAQALNGSGVPSTNHAPAILPSAIAPRYVNIGSTLQFTAESVDVDPTNAAMHYYLDNATSPHASGGRDDSRTVGRFLLVADG